MTVHRRKWLSIIVLALLMLASCSRGGENSKGKELAPTPPSVPVIATGNGEIVGGHPAQRGTLNLDPVGPALLPGGHGRAARAVHLPGAGQRGRGAGRRSAHRPAVPGLAAPGSAVGQGYRGIHCAQGVAGWVCSLRSDAGDRDTGEYRSDAQHECPCPAMGLERADMQAGQAVARPCAALDAAAVPLGPRS
jgi:hypothetical protein